MKQTFKIQGLPASSASQIMAIRNDLMASISALEQISHTCGLCSQTDFTRRRKLTFKDVVLQVLLFRNKSLTSEIFDFYPTVVLPPTKSALIQQRHKIRFEAFEFLFSHFMNNRQLFKKLNGYKLLACDGSEINLLRNPYDENTSVYTKPNTKSYNKVHLNAIYDLLNEVYISFKINDGNQLREHDALFEMVSTLPDLKDAIIIGDRGYGCFNSAAFINLSGSHYVFRIKDLTSKQFMFTQLHLADSEMDVTWNLTLTSHRKKEYVSNPSYIYLQPKSRFKFFDKNGMHNIRLRYVRFKLPTGEYESIITDLEEEEFSTDEIKSIYFKRWGIETSFRELKYAIDVVHFHSRQYNLVMQELIAKLLMYNICSLMTQCIPVNIRSDLMYSYGINFTMSVGLLKNFIKDACLSKLNRLLYDLIPKREGRSCPLGNLHDSKPAKSFNYRVS